MNVYWLGDIYVAGYIFSTELKRWATGSKLKSPMFINISIILAYGMFLRNKNVQYVTKNVDSKTMTQIQTQAEGILNFSGDTKIVMAQIKL